MRENMTEKKVDDHVIYECSNCKNNVILKEGEDPPECCKEKMTPLQACTSDHAMAEHARPMEEEEPCDDGRSG